VGDRRQHLLFSSWIAFAFGRSQANYLRTLRLHLERIIANSNHSRLQRCETQLNDFLSVTLSGVPAETLSTSVVPG
jgi:hypothetical protein